MIYFTKHPRGPALPDDAKKTRSFRSYSDASDWAEANLTPGLYFIRNSNGANLWTGIRECRVKQRQRYGTDEWINKDCGVWMEGRGNI